MRTIALLTFASLLSSCDSASQNLASNLSFEASEILVNGASFEAETDDSALYYSFSLATPAVVAVNFSNSEFLDWQVNFFNSEKNAANSIVSQVTNRLFLEHERLLDRGQYFFKVKREEGASKTARFNLEFEIDDSDSYELNNEFSESKAIQLDQEIFASLRPSGDADFFTFEKSDLDLNLEVTASNSVDFEVFRENGNQVLAGGLETTSGVESRAGVFLNGLSAGTYKLKLSKRHPNHINDPSYSFKLGE